MDSTINAKELRASLPRIVARVGAGERITVIYRSRAAFRLVPVTDAALTELPLEDDPLYRAEPLGASTDGLSARDHDRILYGR